MGVAEEDRVVARTLDEQTEALLALADRGFHALTFSDIEECRDRSDILSGGVVDRGRTDIHRAATAVGAHESDLLIIGPRPGSQRPREWPLLRLIHLTLAIEALEGRRRCRPVPPDIWHGVGLPE